MKIITRTMQITDPSFKKGMYAAFIENNPNFIVRHYDLGKLGDGIIKYMDKNYPNIPYTTELGEFNVELSGYGSLPAPIDWNHDSIYKNMCNLEHKELIVKIMQKAEETPNIGLLDFLKKSFQ